MQDSIETFRQCRYSAEERFGVHEQFAIVFVSVSPGNPHVYLVEDNMYRGSLATESMRT
jgi:hypothetical protein